MFTTIPFWPFIAVTLAIILILGSHRRKRSKIPYPPGPKPRLFVGNVFDVPTSKPWKVYRDWSQIYGDLIHFEVVGQHVVIVNSRDLADRILEKRSRIYSDRPFIPILELSGWTKLATPLLRYSPDWRLHRRFFQHGFRAKVVSDYQSIVSSKVGQFLSNLRQSPDFFANHTRTYAAAAVLATVYGYDIAPSNDRLVEIVEKAVRTGSDAGHPSAIVVNLLPFLRHLPLEVPIFQFQRIARRTRRLLNEMRTVPYEFVKNGMATGKKSLLAEFLEGNIINSGDEHQVDLIKDAAATAYAAGAETTANALVNFFLAMALYPEIQKRAQHELDKVLGKGQLPSYGDRSDLPYIEAVLRETLRWVPGIPLSIFHAALLDDTVDGYFIPKGSAVIPNIWAMTRDETIYPDPESFIPERFLTEDGMACNGDEMLLTFGFGRRICAGRHFAHLALWMPMASILSQFDIAQPEDEKGRPIKCLADVNYSDGLVSQADSFRCVITPRTV